jgi:hypothetical protein
MSKHEHSSMEGFVLLILIIEIKITGRDCPRFMPSIFTPFEQLSNSFMLYASRVPSLPLISLDIKNSQRYFHVSILYSFHKTTLALPSSLSHFSPCSLMPTKRKNTENFYILYFHPKKENISVRIRNV